MDEAVTVRGAVEQALIQKSLRDESFRRRLLEEPKATVEQELGQRLPAEVEVRVVEETPGTLYLVLPPVGAGIGEELSEEQLDQVAGGYSNEVGNSIARGRAEGL